MSTHGYETCITILSNHGADPFLADVDGKTALENAVVSGCRLSARKLLSSRSFSVENRKLQDPSLPSRDQADEISEAIQESSADKSMQLSLYATVETGNCECLKELLRHGTDLERRNQEGHTALHLAVLWGRPEIVLILLQFRASIEARTRDGKTPLALVAETGNVEILKMLLNQGANAESRDQAGRTPVKIARAKNSWNVVGYLEANKKEKTEGKAFV